MTLVYECLVSALLINIGKEGFLMKKMISKISMLSLICSSVAMTNSVFAEGGNSLSKLISGEKFSKEEISLKENQLNVAEKNLEFLKSSGFDFKEAQKIYDQYKDEYDQAKIEAREEINAVRRGRLTNLEIMATVPKEEAFEDYLDAKDVLEKKKVIYDRMMVKKQQLEEKEGDSVPETMKSLFEEQRSDITEAELSFKDAKRRARLLVDLRDRDVERYKKVYNDYSLQNGYRSRAEIVKAFIVPYDEKDQNKLDIIAAENKKYDELKLERIELEKTIRENFLKRDRTNHVVLKRKYEEIKDKLDIQRHEVLVANNDLDEKFAKHVLGTLDRVKKEEADSIKSEEIARKRFLAFESKIMNGDKEPTEKRMQKLKRLMTEWDNALLARRKAHRINFLLNEEFKRRDEEANDKIKANGKLAKKLQYIDDYLAIMEKMNNLEDTQEERDRRDEYEREMQRTRNFVDKIKNLDIIFDNATGVSADDICPVKTDK